MISTLGQASSKDHLKDRWIKCILQSGHVRAVAIELKDLTQELVLSQGLSDTGAKGLGEILMSALLCASYCKKGERINISVKGDGFYSHGLADAYPDAKVRGYVIERPIPLVLDSTEDAKGPWGNGLFSLLKTQDQDGKQPYIGTVPLLTGHFAKDLTFYWMQSEQLPSAVGLSVQVENQKVTVATGFLIQAMPGATDQEIKEIETQLIENKEFRVAFNRGADPITTLSQLFQNLGFTILEERQVEKYCPCTSERVERAISLLGKEELESMLVEQGKAIARCDFCGINFEVNGKRLNELIAKTGQSS